MILLILAALSLAVLGLFAAPSRRRSSLADRAARDVAEAARETEQSAELWRRLGARNEREAKSSKVIPINSERKHA